VSARLVEIADLTISVVSVASTLPADSMERTSTN
jgi:hypothetical protein